MSRVSTARVLRATAAASPRPVGGITDPRFRYVPAVATDISKTFRRVRAELAKGRLL